MKVFSIIMAVLYALFFILLFSLNLDNDDNVILIYVMCIMVSSLGFILSIMGIVYSRDKRTPEKINAQLVELARLRDLGVLTEEEFEAKKRQLIV